MNKKNTNTLQKLMGESCEEGGPSPSHNIPQKCKELRRNAQNDLLFICPM
jgi:hypothetical protein